MVAKCRKDCKEVCFLCPYLFFLLCVCFCLSCWWWWWRWWWRRRSIKHVLSSKLPKATCAYRISRFPGSTCFSIDNPFEVQIPAISTSQPPISSPDPQHFCPAPMSIPMVMAKLSTSKCLGLITKNPHKLMEKCCTRWKVVFCSLFFQGF